MTYDLGEFLHWTAGTLLPQEEVRRLFELRRTYEAAGAVSLSELGLQARAVGSKLLRLHQDVRGELGCLTLQHAAPARAAHGAA